MGLLTSVNRMKIIPHSRAQGSIPRVSLESIKLAVNLAITIAVHYRPALFSYSNAVLCRNKPLDELILLLFQVFASRTSEVYE